MVVLGFVFIILAAVVAITSLLAWTQKIEDEWDKEQLRGIPATFHNLVTKTLDKLWTF